MNYPFYTLIFSPFLHMDSVHVKSPTLDQVIQSDLIIWQTGNENTKIIKNHWGWQDRTHEVALRGIPVNKLFEEIIDDYVMLVDGFHSKEGSCGYLMTTTVSHHKAAEMKTRLQELKGRPEGDFLYRAAVADLKNKYGRGESNE